MNGADVWPCRTIVEGTAEGRAVVSPQPFSFAGELDLASGRVSNRRSTLYGTCLTGTVFVFPHGRGSSSSSSIIAEAIRRGTAPAAIVSSRVEHLLVVGVLVAGAMFGRTLPMAAVPEAVLAQLRDGDLLIVDASAGTIRHRAAPGS